MKHLILFIFLLLTISISAIAANKFWVGGTIAPKDNNWNNTNNWSLSDGGTGGAAVPVNIDIAFFTASAVANCDLNVPVTVAGIDLNAGYTGIVTVMDNLTLGSTGSDDVDSVIIIDPTAIGTTGLVVNAGTFNFTSVPLKLAGVNGNWTQTGGNVNGGTNSIGVTGTLNTTGGTFTSTSAILSVRGNLDIVAAGFAHNNGELRMSANTTRDIIIDGNNPSGVILNKFSINTTSANTIVRLANNDSLTVLNDLTIIQGRFQNGTAERVILFGNFINQQIGGTGFGSTIAMKFSGSANQTISLASPGLIDGNLIINKTTANNTVTLLSPVFLEEVQSITFIKGKIVTTSVNLLTLTAASTVTISGAGDSSFVDGPLVKNGNSAFTFPIGDKNVYAPLSISGTATFTSNLTGVGTFTAEYIRSNPNPGFPIGSRFPADNIKSIGKCEYWTMSGNPTNPAAVVWLSYNNVRSCGITQPSTLLVVAWDGTQWRSVGGATATIGTTSYLRTSSPIDNVLISSNRPFDLASTDSLANPLPLHLTAFKAKYQEGYVALNWETATETDNDHFTIERSSDGSLFTSLATIKGAGNSNVPLTYSYNDNSIITGTYYYRLKMTAFDGSSAYSNIVTVGVNETGLSLFPNPVASGEDISLLVPYLKDKTVDVRIISADGRLIATTSVTINNVNKASLNLKKPLSPGLYFIEMIGEENSLRSKLTVW